MSTEQEDRGVEPKNVDQVLNGEDITERVHVEDGLGNPAEPEDDLAGD